MTQIHSMKFMTICVLIHLLRSSSFCETEQPIHVFLTWLSKSLTKVNSWFQLLVLCHDSISIACLWLWVWLCSNAAVFCAFFYSAYQSKRALFCLQEHLRWKRVYSRVQLSDVLAGPRQPSVWERVENRAAEKLIFKFNDKQNKATYLQGGRIFFLLFCPYMINWKKSC